MTDPLTDRFSSELLFSEACPAAAKEQVSWLAASGAFLRFFLLRTSNLHALFVCPPSHVHHAMASQTDFSAYSDRIAQASHLIPFSAPESAHSLAYFMFLFRTLV